MSLGAPVTAPLRLGIYADLGYSTKEGAVFTDEAVVRFLSALTERVERVTFFGRLAPEPAEGPYRLPADAELIALPHYSDLTDLRGVVRAARESCRTFAAALDRLDAVWLFGPHPLALAFTAIARRRRKPVILGVRQDFPRYIAGRIPGPAWSWAIPAAWAAEGIQRLLARRLPTVVVGEELASAYGAGRHPVLPTSFSLVGEDDLVAPQSAAAKQWNGELRLLNVGRLGPEKNPTLLPEIVAGLRRSDSRWRLAIAGDGPLYDAVASRARELGVADAVELLGYVPNGPGLREQYRRAHAFLHVSLTEGLPQVLVEAQAAGLPVVATDVGGVAEALGRGEAGLLVPPADAGAAARALERLRDEPPLRERLIDRGLARAETQTLDARLDQILAFIRDHAASRGPG